LNAASHSPLKLRYGLIRMVTFLATSDFWLSYEARPTARA
jgi:hypothetical protein